jgi:hypothetical protein
MRSLVYEDCLNYVDIGIRSSDFCVVPRLNAGAVVRRSIDEVTILTQ